MIKALAAYTVSTLGSLTLGTTLQVGFRPDTAPDECTTISSRTGGITDNDQRRQRQWPIQIVTRGLAYHAAEDECTRIFEFLRSLRQVYLAGFRIYTAQGIQPQYLGQDSKARHEFSANLVLRIRKD